MTPDQAIDIVQRSHDGGALIDQFADPRRGAGDRPGGQHLSGGHADSGTDAQLRAQDFRHGHHVAIAIIPWAYVTIAEFASRMFAP
jgi:hypothetical protein